MIIERVKILSEWKPNEFEDIITFGKSSSIDESGLFSDEVYDE